MSLLNLNLSKKLFVFFVFISLVHQLQAQFKKTKSTDSNICTFFENTFPNFSQNEVYLFAGLGLAKQNVNVGTYTTAYNYNVADYQNNIFKPGYFGGVRIDGKYKKEHLYSLAFSLNKVVTGLNFQSSSKISPFVGDFVGMKPDHQFFILNIAPHYKKLLPILDTSKYKLYAIVGPSVDWRLSDQSLDNQVNHNYKQIQLKGDLGLEFDNKTYYTLFLHYHQGITSFTKDPINSKINSFEFGLMLKAKDLF